VPISIETYLAIDQREEGPIPTGPNILTSHEFSTTLPNQDTAGRNELPAESFYSKSLADAIAPVSDAALSFFVCHKPPLPN
jgi:hypothetical protein